MGLRRVDRHDKVKSEFYRFSCSSYYFIMANNGYNNVFMLCVVHVFFYASFCLFLVYFVVVLERGQVQTLVSKQHTIFCTCVNSTFFDILGTVC